MTLLGLAVPVLPPGGPPEDLRLIPLAPVEQEHQHGPDLGHRQVGAFSPPTCRAGGVPGLLRTAAIMRVSSVKILDNLRRAMIQGHHRPVDRSKKGSKHTLLVDRHGVPMAIRTAGANASDHTQIIPIVLAFPKVGGKPGRPKEMPDDLYADRGYDS